MEAYSTALVVASEAAGIEVPAHTRRHKPVGALNPLFTELPNAGDIGAFKKLLPWQVSKEALVF